MGIVDILGWLRRLKEVWQMPSLKALCIKVRRPRPLFGPRLSVTSLLGVIMAGYVFALRSTNYRALLLRSRNLASLASVRGRSIFALPTLSLIFGLLKGCSLGPDLPNPYDRFQ